VRGSAAAAQQWQRPPSVPRRSLFRVLASTTVAHRRLKYSCRPDATLPSRRAHIRPAARQLQTACPPRHVTAPTPRLPPTTGTDRRPTGDADGRKGEYEGRAALLKVREGQRGAEEQVHTASDAPTNCDGRETCRTSRLTEPCGPLVSGSPRPLTLDRKKNILCLFPVSVTFFEPTGSAAR